VSERSRATARFIPSARCWLIVRMNGGSHRRHLGARSLVPIANTSSAQPNPAAKEQATQSNGQISIETLPGRGRSQRSQPGAEVLITCMNAR
jgi:hypothetical protein